MKIGIISFQYVDNYGAILQTYALRTFLNNLGHDATIINYNNIKLRQKKLSILLKARNSIWRIVRSVLVGKSKHIAFEHFRKNYLNINDPVIIDRLSLIDYINKNQFDYLITGSDQVWNPDITNNDTSYLLDMNLDKTKKISYAASFGKTIVQLDWIQKVEIALQDFKAISVRESTGKKILENKSNKFNISIVSDPVFLLNIKEWKSIASETHDRNYILCYIMPGDNSVEEMIEESAKNISKITGLPIIFLGRKEYKKYDNIGSDRFNASPQEFLSYIYNSSYVLTNSFHGTAFSIIFRKQFYSFINDNLPCNKQLNSRIIDLLNELGLYARCKSKTISSWEQLYISQYDDSFNLYKDRSINFLYESLK